MGIHYVGHYETYASLGFQHCGDHAGRGAEDYARSAESQMERQDIHRQHDDGDPLDRQHDGKLSAESTWRKSPSKRSRSKTWSGAALAGLVVSGEVPLSPTIFDANITQAKQKGAPVEWRPLEPVVTTVAYTGFDLESSPPYAALLFIDWIHSKEGQQMIMKGGLWSPREDIGSLGAKIQKILHRRKVSVEEAEKKYAEWEG